MNTDSEKELFEGLNKLCELDAFYFSEQDYDNKYKIRSYSYRLASYTDFQSPFALDCRGVAFVINKEIKDNMDYYLFTRAFKKSFNLGEGIPKEDIINNKPKTVMQKLDGSLILVGKVNNTLVAKSKTSINSDHALMAQKLINSNKKLQEFLNYEIDNGFTPIFELVGPNFKIVLNYPENELIYLGKVNNSTGEEIVTSMLPLKFKELNGIKCSEIYDLSWDEILTIQETHKPSIEGFIVRSNKTVKVKVKSYVQLHNLKDNINNLSLLIPLIVNDNLDDLMGNFIDDKETINYIVSIQELISKSFNKLVIDYINLRDSYYKEYNENRKEFSINNKNKNMFSYVMKNLNTGVNQEEVAQKCAKDCILRRFRTKLLADEYIKNLENQI